VAAQAEVAVDLADAVLFVVDVNVGATATDEHVVRMLRASKRPVILVANKADDPIKDPLTAELWSLGLGEPWPVSALHGRGVADLLDHVMTVLPDVSAVAKQEIGGPRRVAILGRPNVGKSSLLNKAAGEERVVVNEMAGTTRDPVDEQVELGGKIWTFVDTAGIRKRVHLQQGADFYASLRTAAALEKAEVAVVVIDVTEPVSVQDLRIIELVLESGRALVLAYNKWDLLDDDRRRYLEREIEQDLAHVAWAPRVNISARTGRHLEKLVPALEVALDSWDTRIPTGKLNALIAELAAEHPHPVRGGKQPRILFGTQASTRPPTFVLFTTGFLDPQYRRFITRRLREVYGFEGTPIVVQHEGAREAEALTRRRRCEVEAMGYDSDPESLSAFPRHRPQGDGVLPVRVRRRPDRADLRRGRRHVSGRGRQGPARQLETPSDFMLMASDTPSSMGHERGDNATRSRSAAPTATSGAARLLGQAHQGRHDHPAAGDRAMGRDLRHGARRYGVLWLVNISAED
jgi:GTP-binding protein